MKDTEKDICLAALGNGSELADTVSEGFLLAITAAYVAGVEAGKRAAQSAA